MRFTLLKELTLRLKETSIRRKFQDLLWLWIIAEAIFPKPGKLPHEVSSYRPIGPIALQSIISKFFQKLLLKKNPEISPKKI